jgi:hypothetical protein
MSETNPHNLSESKKCFRNFAALYAIFTPLVCLILLLVLLVLIGGSYILYGLAALIFISSLIMGVLRLFGGSLQHKERCLIFFGMLVSTVCGGFASIICLAGMFR